MKKILLFGGAGFIGSNLAKKLVNDGHSVIVFDDFSTGRTSNLDDIKEKIVIKRADVRSYESVREFVKEIQPDAVYFLAALHYIPDCNKNPQKAWNINVHGAENVARAVSELSNKPRFIHISTSSVYKPSEEPIKELHPTEPFEIYGKTKLEGEKAVKELCKKYGIDHFIVRPFSVYGPFVGIPQVIPEIISQIKKGNKKIVLGNLETFRDFVYVADVANALSLFLARGVSGEVYNLGANRSDTIKSVTEIIKELLRDREIEFISDTNLFRRGLERNRLIGDSNKIIKELEWLPEADLRRGLELTLRAEKLLR